MGLDADSDPFEPNRQRIPDQAELEAVLRSHGVTEDTSLVLYDGGDGRYAAYLYWILTSYDHRDRRLLDGSLQHWLDAGYPTTAATAAPSPAEYTARGRFDHLRAHRDDVVRATATRR